MARTAERGYSAKHRAERKRWQSVVEAGDAVCCRCDFPIAPEADWHLDHAEDRETYLGVSHARCNLRAGGQKGRRNARRRRRVAADRLGVAPEAVRLGGMQRVSRDWFGDAVLVNGRLYRPLS